MAGGGAGTDVYQQGQTSADNGQGASTPSTSNASQASADYYNALMRPGTTSDYISSIYQQSLGRAPDAAGAGYWANQAAKQGWTGQQLAQNINAAGEAERAKSGYISQVNPNEYSAQSLNRPSYYNTNPIGVDYANIFNPAARSVTSNQLTLTPQQQAQYLGDWANAYSQQNRAATEAANQARVNTANAQWEAYLKDKAAREAQAKIDEAVKAKEAEWQQMYASQNSNNNWGYGDSGGGGGGSGGEKEGGLIGVRSLKGKTKP